MDENLLIDAIVRQTTVLLAQLATRGGSRAQFSHTANQVFLDLVAALKEQGLGNKVIADMFGLALRSYHSKVQRLAESRTDRGRSLWEAVYSFLQDEGKTGPVLRSDVLARFAADDDATVRAVLRDLVDSGLVYRTGRGDAVQFRLPEGEAELRQGDAADEAHLVWVAIHRLGGASRTQLRDALAIEEEVLERALALLVRDGRVRETDRGVFVSDGCVLPLGLTHGWEAALFDHYQAMVSAMCAKLGGGERTARASDLIGGSTFSYTVWPEHPYYEEATRFLATFRSEGSALRKKIAAYNAQHSPPRSGGVRVVTYGGQNVLELDDNHKVDP